MAAIAVNVVNLYTVGSNAPSDGWFTITFDIDLSPASVAVQVQEPGSDVFVTKLKDVDWELDKTSSRFRFLTTTYEPEDGTIVRVERCTSRTRVVNWTPGSTMTAAQINLDNDQEFFILQEIEAELGRAMLKDLTGSFWQAEGLEVQNSADATQNTSLVTLQQLQAGLLGAEIAFLEDVDVYSFTGDGIQTDFELVGIDSVLAEQLIVTINGLVQHAGEPASTSDGLYYEVLSVDDPALPTGFADASLRFTQPPANNDSIEVRSFTGVVRAEIGDAVFGGGSIEDGSIGLNHFDLNTTPDSFLLIGATGDPTYHDATDITLLEPALLTWLGERTLSDIQGVSAFGDENMNMGANRITNLGTGTATSDAVRLDQILISKVFKGTFSNNAAKTLGFIPDVVIMTVTGTASGFDVEIGYTLVINGAVGTYHATGSSRGGDHANVWQVIVDNPGNGGRLTFTLEATFNIIETSRKFIAIKYT